MTLLPAVGHQLAQHPVLTASTAKQTLQKTAGITSTATPTLPLREHVCNSAGGSLPEQRFTQAGRKQWRSFGRSLVFESPLVLRGGRRPLVMEGRSARSSVQRWDF